jgi:hypothetical protein
VDLHRPYRITRQAAARCRGGAWPTPKRTPYARRSVQYEIISVSV